MIEISPDIKFKNYIEKATGTSLSGCMQCGTCSVVCSLSPQDRPFPRKEMIWAAWGLKEKLMGNTDIWLCHQCGECSAQCPRGAKPAEVVSAIRQMSYKYYARPKFMGQIVSKPALLPVALLIPIVIISVILYMAGTLTIPTGPVNYSKFFPHAWLNSSFTLLTFIAYFFASIGLVKFWGDMKSQHPNVSFVGGFLKNLVKAKKDILLHSSFGKCNSKKLRNSAHFLVFYGFILLLVVTAFAIVAAITHNYPLGFLNPFKLMGNIAALMLLAGLGIMIVNRIKKNLGVGKSTYSDWLLLISLVLLTISGTIVEIARFQDWGFAYHWYFFHLVCVWFVIIYLPYTKFGHMLYRTLAMAMAIAICRK